MSSTHRLHQRHTGRNEADAVAVAQGNVEACSSCREPLSPLERPAFYCNECNYTVCNACDKPKSHPVHPVHDLYSTTPIVQWRCDVCKRSSSDIEDLQCYHCEECSFYLCKKCFDSVNSPLHAHTLYRTDVRYVYHQSNGDWLCDVCRNNNGPGHVFPAHCSSCQFDLCDNCIKPYRSTFHPDHLLYKADSNVTYRRFNGGWRCDNCSRSFIPQRDNLPYHCSECEYDLCQNCMSRSSTDSNLVGFDVAGQDIRGRNPVTDRGNPIMAPSEELDQQVGRSGASANSGGDECVICLERPKDATIVHGETGHVCCCTICANNLKRRGARCPICRGPIENVIRHYTV